MLRGDAEIVIASRELRVGDQMVVQAGERVASDGVIRTGRSSVDASAITGESMPVKIGKGDEVVAGSINGRAENPTLPSAPPTRSSADGGGMKIVPGGRLRRG